MVAQKPAVTLTIDPGHFDLNQLQVIHTGDITLALAESSRSNIRKSQQVVQAAADADGPVYGVNTGFGKLANQRIDKEKPPPCS
jgi:histidine ammonia-lyase